MRYRASHMIPLIFLLFLFGPVSTKAQHFIGKSRKKVESLLRRQIRQHDSLQMTLSAQGDQLRFRIGPVRVQPAEMVYTFDQRGRCRSEKVTASCDSCFQKFLDHALAPKKWGWEKINENQYISGYASRMLIELSPEKNSYTFTIFRASWSREQYALMRKK